MDEVNFPRFDLFEYSSLREAEFEDICIRLLGRMYTSCYCFPFKPVLDCDGVGWAPDIAVVDKNWEYWFVIEVELLCHSFEKHVLPQVLGIRDGTHGEASAEIISRNTGLALASAKTFVEHVPRYVAVITECEEPEWHQALAAERIQMLSISKYTRHAGSPAYLVSGVLEASARSAGFGQVVAASQAIVFKSSEFWKEGEYNILEPSGLSKWSAYIYGETVWLKKQKGVLSLPDKRFVQFICQDDGLISIRLLG